MYSFSLSNLSFPLLNSISFVLCCSALCCRHGKALYKYLVLLYMYHAYVMVAYMLDASLEKLDLCIKFIWSCLNSLNANVKSFTCIPSILYYIYPHILEISGKLIFYSVLKYFFELNTFALYGTTLF